MKTRADENITEVNFGIRLIQRAGMLTFGTDAFLLSAFARSRGNGFAADFGTGSGIIALLASSGDSPFTHIDAIEQSSELCELASRNSELNGVKTVTCINIDVRDYKGRSLDCIMTNPPYMRSGSGIENADTLNNDARREHHGTIEDFAVSASKALKVGGRFLVVYRPDRLPDLIFAMKQSGIEPKILIPVYHMAGRAPSLILCEGVRGGGCDMKFTRDLILNTKDGKRTDDAAYIYEKCLLPHDLLTGK